MFRYFLWMIVINGMLVQNIFVREMYIWQCLNLAISGVFRTELTLIVMKGMYRMTPVHISGQTSSL